MLAPLVRSGTSTILSPSTHRFSSPWSEASQLRRKSQSFGYSFCSSRSVLFFRDIMAGGGLLSSIPRTDRLELYPARVRVLYRPAPYCVELRDRILVRSNREYRRRPGPASTRPLWSTKPHVRPLARSSGFEPEVCEHALAHLQGSATLSTYFGWPRPRSCQHRSQDYRHRKQIGGALRDDTGGRCRGQGQQAEPTSLSLRPSRLEQVGRVEYRNPGGERRRSTRNRLPGACRSK